MPLRQQAGSLNYDLKLTSATQASLRFSTSSKLMKSNVKGWLRRSASGRTATIEKRKNASTQYGHDVEMENAGDILLA